MNQLPINPAIAPVYGCFYTNNPSLSQEIPLDMCTNGNCIPLSGILRLSIGAGNL